MNAASAVALLAWAVSGAALAACGGAVAGDPVAMPSSCPCFVFGCLADCSRIVAEDAAPPCVPPGVATLRLSWRRAPFVALPPDALSRTPLLRRFEAREVADLHTVDERVFASTPGLEHLQLTGSKVETLFPGTFASNLNLSTVDLSNNRLSSLPAELFKKNALLVQLNLADNLIEVLLPETFKNNLVLQQLDLSGNPLSELPPDLLQHCVHLRSLRLGGTAVSSLHRSSFSRNAGLEALDLSASRLEELPATLLQSQALLTQLDLSSNDIAAIPEKLFSATSSLRVVNASHNSLRLLPAALFLKTPGLRVLDVSWNDLRFVARQLLWWCPSLEELHLQGNELTSLHAETLSGNTRLRVLDLSHNLMADMVPDSTLTHNSQLERLDLSHNLLQHVCWRRLDPVWNSLKVLDISYNQITSLSWPNKRPRVMESLRIQGNPCSCSAKLVKLFVPPKMPQIKIKGIITNHKKANHSKQNTQSGGDGDQFTEATVNTTNNGNEVISSRSGVGERGSHSAHDMSDSQRAYLAQVSTPHHAPTETHREYSLDVKLKPRAPRMKRDAKRKVFCPYGTAFNAAGAESGYNNCKRNGTRRTPRRRARSPSKVAASPHEYWEMHYINSGVQTRRSQSNTAAEYTVKLQKRLRRSDENVDPCIETCTGLPDAGCFNSSCSVSKPAVLTLVVAIVIAFVPSPNENK